MTTTTTYDFDVIVPRRNTNCAKWDMPEADVMPMWVADMDFQSPPSVVQRIQDRLAHGVFGYGLPPSELRDVLVERMARLYDWTIDPEHIVFVPGLVLGLNVISRTVGKAGDGILMQTPVYGPFISVPPNNGRFAQHVDLVRVDDNAHTFHYEIDFDAFEAAITPQTSMFFLCNPHNPGGRAFTRDELTRLADICTRHNILICSDEIHCDLLLDDTQHIPIASLSPEIARRTVTLMAPSKTFNMPGLACSMMIVPDDDLRQQLQGTVWGMGAMVNVLGYEAAIGAYTGGDAWLQALRQYLTENRDVVVNYIREHLPMLKVTVPEATYLAWIDASALPLPDDTTPYKFFLDEAKVALSEGQFFGHQANHYVRLNFGCSRHVLMQGLERMKAAIETLVGA